MKNLFSFIIYFCCLNSLYSQSDSVFKLTRLIEPDANPNLEAGIKIDKCWKYHKGDNIKWAEQELDTKDWTYTNTSLNLSKLPQGFFESNGWFRIKIQIDTQIVNKTIALLLTQSGASEIYIDGKLVKTFGYIGNESLKNDTLYDPQNVPIGIQFQNTRNHIIAVRYRNREAMANFKSGKFGAAGFEMKLSELDYAIRHKSTYNSITTSVFMFYFTFFIALSILHFMFFIFYRSNKSNLYYSIFSAGFGSIFLCIVGNQSFTNPHTISMFNSGFSILPTIYSTALLAMLYNIFYNKLPKIYWVWFGLILFSLISEKLHFNLGIIDTILNSIINLIIIIEPIRIIITSIVKKRDGAWIIGTGVITTIVFFTITTILFATGNGHIFYQQNNFWGVILGILVGFSTLSIPLSMSIYLARDFAKTSKNLEKKLIEVEDLSAKSIEQEKEKQLILSNQNILLEKQVKERTYEIVEQKKVIEEKNKDITDSISYTKRIQDATLPSKELKYKLFPEAFVLFKPKDIVSGDFYWFTEINGTKFIAAADCTGHGVPGAMVSIVCSNALNRTVKEFGITDPGKILDKVRELVLETFSSSEKNEGTVKDGMDISLCSIQVVENSQNSIINWAGANNPLWYVQNSVLNEITANKQPIGRIDDPLPFTSHQLQLNKGDTIYLFTDGYADQFGGPKGKKFKYKQLEETFLAINNLPMVEQETVLDKKFEEWRNTLAQIDDVLIIGIKL